MSASAQTPTPRALWAVWRQDDNGVTAVVRRGLTEESAKALARRLEKRGHKQLYWVEREAIEER